jgi:hypothetical protein
MIPNNACLLCLTAAAGTELAEASFGSAQRGGLFTLVACETLTAVYTPKGFLLHAALLGQACAHCPIFVTAATRRCPGSVSVPMRRATLSRPLPVAALVGRYPTNKLIGHGPLPDRQARRSPPLITRPCGPVTSSGISSTFAKGIAPAVIPVSGVRYPCITLPFATHRILLHGSYDLHVLTMPPAFVLSQDQTLRFVLWPAARRPLAS